MSHPLKLSVLVPVLNGRELLPATLGAIFASDLPRVDWELVVVDDGSTDGTAEWASTRADRVSVVDDGPKGPGFARNQGAAEVDGDVIVLIDADVQVGPQALRRIRDHFTDSPDVGAVFGAYDEHPGSPDFLSQYRNLYHRYVHLVGAGDAETFWAGCGAVRRDLFLRLGGFDTIAYPRPQIEDIELGYRIRDAGYRIVLDPEIGGSHLKKWTLLGIIRTDLLDRGIPWMRLLLGDGPGGKRSTTLNVTGTEKFKTALMGLGSLGFLISALIRSPFVALGAGLAILLIVVLTLPVYRWFAKLRGWAFALRAIPMSLLYYFISGLSVAIALGLHLFGSKANPR